MAAPRTSREELLDDPILERMEGHHGEPPAGLEQPLGRDKAAKQLAELVVDRDAQGLEGPGRGMGQLAALAGATRAIISASGRVRS